MAIPEPQPSYILQNQVAHTRFLPSASKHSFAYPTLSVLVSINALEQKQLDLLGGWLFGYGSTWGRVTGLRPSGYLYSGLSDKRSIRSKVVDVLDQHGYSGCQLDDAWLMTMPSFLGIEGINPLSVYFCYRRDRVSLWLLVLEVHNTFSERHVYVLEANSKSEQPPLARFDHQWTFPRQFHVSPFNDRSGHYMCQIIAPSHPPSITRDPSHPSPHPVIKLTLLTPPPHPQKKLVAIIRTTHSTPLSSTTLLSALARAPFILLQTLPRIIYQAYLLHYHKYLDVYQRPEPGAPDPTVESHLPTVPNAIQPAETYVGRGVGWQTPGPLERWCQRRVSSYLQTQCARTHISITFIPANPFEKRTTIKSPGADSDSGSDGSRTLEIYYRSPRLFTLLFMMPSPMHAILLGAHADAVFSLSSEQLFVALFTAETTVPPQPRSQTPWSRLAQYIRSLSVPSPTTLNLPIPPHHALDGPPTLITLSVLLMLSLLALFERIVFDAFGARFVRGDEPWGGWARLGSRSRLGKWGGLGSVRRAGGAY